MSDAVRDLYATAFHREKQLAQLGLQWANAPAAVRAAHELGNPVPAEEFYTAQLASNKEDPSGPQGLVAGGDLPVGAAPAVAEGVPQAAAVVGILPVRHKPVAPCCALSH